MTETKNEQDPNQQNEENTLLVDLTKDGRYIVNWKLISTILRRHEDVLSKHEDKIKAIMESLSLKQRQSLGNNNDRS